MPARYRRRWKLWLPATFAVVALSFIVGTVFVQSQLVTTDHATWVIAEDAAPSVERLSSANIDLRYLQALLERDLDTAEHGGPSNPKLLASVRDDLDGQLERYLLLPFFDAERVLWHDISSRKRELDRSLDRYSRAVEGGHIAEARSALRDDITPKIDDLTLSIAECVRLNAEQAHALALEIQSSRRRAAFEGYLLDGISTLIAVGGFLLLRAVVLAHARLIERNADLERDRARELEQFAGRVAHDILSPLNAAGAALQLAGMTHEERAKELASRASASILRVRTLVDGLLEFARAGAAADHGGSADVAEVIEDVASELRPHAIDAGIDFRTKNPSVGRVNCHPGVLTSLVANLARNAIKYVGDGVDRRVEIASIDLGDRIRVEVSDTGPGLDPDVEPRIFQPYARGRSTQPGIGLGLATVKRLADSHGGSAGVRSVPGKGCRFWFELPKSSTPAAALLTTPAHA